MSLESTRITQVAFEAAELQSTPMVASAVESGISPGGGPPCPSTLDEQSADGRTLPPLRRGASALTAH